MWSFVLMRIAGKIRRFCEVLMDRLEKKKKRLTLNCEFKRAYYKGSYKAAPLLITYVLKNRKSCTRYGITTSKKVGNAVMRNRARRVIRAAARQALEGVPKGYDIVFVARAATPAAKSQEIYAVMKKQLDKLLLPKG